MRGFALILCLCTNLVPAAELTVIFDNGQAKPISELLGPLMKANKSREKSVVAKPNLGAADLQQLLPIRSSGVTPGEVTSRKLDLPFARPFFLVGSDTASQRWLAQYRAHLLAIGASGLLVEAATVEDLERMATIADGLPMTPASGADVAKALGIEHYPVAISEGRIWQ